MRIQPFLFAGIFLLIALACSNAKEGDSGKQISNSESTNSVEKWKIDPKVGEKVIGMRAAIETFHQENENAPDYQILSDTLNERIKDIFSSCTMPSGPAHDAFHAYISEAIAYLKELSDEENNSPDSTLTKLEDHLALFLKRFE